MKRNKVLTIGLLIATMMVSSFSVFANDASEIISENSEFTDVESYVEISERVYYTQKTLKYLNLYDGDITGILNNETEKALITFQERNGLPVTGVLSTTTVDKIYEYQEEMFKLEKEEYLRKTEERKQEEKRQEDENKVKNKKVETIKSPAKAVDWFKGGNSLIPRKSYFKITDVKTGKTFNAYRMGGSNHSDTEPATKKDMEIMKSIYGSWSWDRRSIIVETQSGQRIAASMNGMPHGSKHIGGNGFNGHFCVHILNSKTHGSGKVDPGHQRAIKFAIGK